jgi:hypothetical protein
MLLGLFLLAFVLIKGKEIEKLFFFLSIPTNKVGRAFEDLASKKE